MCGLGLPSVSPDTVFQESGPVVWAWLPMSPKMLPQGDFPTQRCHGTSNQGWWRWGAQLKFWRDTQVGNHLPAWWCQNISRPQACRACLVGPAAPCGRRLAAWGNPGGGLLASCILGPSPGGGCHSLPAAGVTAPSIAGSGDVLLPKPLHTSIRCSGFSDAICLWGIFK